MTEMMQGRNLYAFKNKERVIVSKIFELLNMYKGNSSINMNLTH